MLADNLFIPLYVYSLAGAGMQYQGQDVGSVRPVVSLFLLGQIFLTFDDKALLDATVATVLMANPDLAERRLSTGDSPVPTGAEAESSSTADGGHKPATAEDGALKPAAAAKEAGLTGGAGSTASMQVVVYGEAFFLAVLDLMSCVESDFTALPAVCMLQAMMENPGENENVSVKGVAPTLKMLMCVSLDLV